MGATNRNICATGFVCILSLFLPARQQQTQCVWMLCCSSAKRRMERFQNQFQWDEVCIGSGLFWIVLWIWLDPAGFMQSRARWYRIRLAHAKTVLHTVIWVAIVAVGNQCNLDVTAYPLVWLQLRVCKIQLITSCCWCWVPFFSSACAYRKR